MEFRAYRQDGLLLPFGLAAEMGAYEMVRQQEEMRAEAQARRRTEEQPRIQKKKDDADVLREKLEAWQERLACHPGPQLKVIDWAEVEAALDLLEGVDDGERHRASLRLCGQRSEYSAIACIPPDFRAKLDAIQRSMPNFAPALDYLRGECSIAEHGDQTIQPVPMLVVGPAGVGKSLFVRKLADVFNSGLLTIRMENAQTNSALAGSSAFWSNSQPGDFWRMLLTNEYANFMTFLDEIDKVSTGDRYDPLGALYSLLEPTTAREFCDLCFPQIKLDASRVMWFATANDISQMPQPLLSRFRVFHIPAPVDSEAYAIAQAVLAETLDKHPAMQLSAGVIEKLAAMPPRRMHHAAREALGRALYETRSVILPQDFPEERRPRRMGF